MSTRPKEKPSGKEQPKDEDAVPTETSDLDSPPTKERWLNEMWVNIIALENKMTNALKRWEHGRQPQTDAEAHEISDIYLDALCLIQNVLSGTQLPKEITKLIRIGTWPYASFILTPVMERSCTQRGIDSQPITIFAEETTKVNLPAAMAAARRLFHVTETNGELAKIDDDVIVSPRKLSDLFGVPESRRDALRQRLDAWRKKNPGSEDWIEHDSRKTREPKFLYRVGAVKKIVEDVKATSE